MKTHGEEVADPGLPECADEGSSYRCRAGAVERVFRGVAQWNADDAALNGRQKHAGQDGDDGDDDEQLDEGETAMKVSLQPGVDEVDAHGGRMPMQHQGVERFEIKDAKGWVIVE